MHSVVIHNYSGNLSAIEFGEKNTIPHNFLVFIGGLGDGFLSVPYVPPLAEAITQRFGKRWVLVQALISSSYLGFGTGSLRRDCKELSKLIKYLRTTRGSKDSKVILMGHSTGSQDTLEYMSKYSFSGDCPTDLNIDAGILQAPVSDSEGLKETFGEDQNLIALIAKSQALIDDGKPNELMPASCLKYTFGSPVTAYRFHSLLSQRGDDDYFSSYLHETDLKKSFGHVLRPILVLYSGDDEFASSDLDKNQLLVRWRAACDPKYWSKHSKIVEGATHNVGKHSKIGALDQLIKSVLSFVEDEFERVL
ncbi:DUF1749-domain-containing protein [Metschnikowia bicuspidata var. bicuspidata NRRL YB-4993]|uniref:DUF1749-domain-containing protein n=1 Tax=Metschnikowia bicuspidata var. bicuspidata NRRL YB-4993 TaxID=869754 RepID=A0A1A0H955_9ASCO|nr:DUF1749-domain-containing protein [Metschnikowia bicuspidata var. bicuspidata NRRL YB-4993]OBA20530.1 DUF1749-domain-containing protein [Metschnikowia bicuspidata var. bicuspidata NRRL YB-4993]